VAVLCEGHLLVEDVPGTGKTTLAKAVAASLGCTFRRIQFTPDLLPSDVTGINYYNQKLQDFQFRPGPVLSQTAPRRAPKVHCSKPCRNARSRLTAKRACYRDRS
jgi:MoxR-like ATPase